MELNHNKKLLNEKQGKKRNSDASYLRDKQQEETLTKKYETAQVWNLCRIGKSYRKKKFL